MGKVYLPTQKVVRGLISVEDSAKIATLRLECYVRQRNERLMAAARINIDREEQKLSKEYRRTKNERIQEWQKGNNKTSLFDRLKK